MRLDRYHAYLPAQSKPPGPYSPAVGYKALDIFTFTNAAPRIALSFALTSDKKTVLKATYGRFNDVPNAQAGRTFNQNDYFAWRYAWSDPNRDGVYQPGEEGSFVATESAQGAGLKILNPDLRQGKEDEASLFVERQLFQGISVRGGYVFKRQFDRAQEVNPARPFSAYSLAIPGVDPGPDGKVGTADDGGAVTYYDYIPSLKGAAFDQAEQVNTPGNTNYYHNFEVTLMKRSSAKWEVLTSFLATRANAWRVGIPLTPNDTFAKSTYWEHNFKLSGSYRFPWDIQLSGYFESLSGAPQARDVRFTSGLKQLSQVILLMEPLGSQRLPALNRLNFRLQKKQRLFKGQLALGVDIFNALNTNAATSISRQSGPTYGQISAIVPARNARLVASYKF